ncbi:hypothetical protein [Azospirillum sp. TSO35-2]|uniref:hypothetical protein n=1 Tax=Azospirillum sp. TSO35-2 TaxID=716796 RepID=UPI000D616515|nr:hypothetical protein [Azospirillum sp. TSO35-2]PWC38966.1 hypothetical protein TSO352_01555 [Azospirillum sp. TSO35-2]
MNLNSLASDMVNTALACEKALPGRANADDHDLARLILVEPDHVWHVCETYARATRTPVEDLPVSQLRGLISDIVLSKLPKYD